jgi:CRISPR-associated protein Csm4
MKEYLIRLTPRSSFQIALHSDTLFGAICWGIRTLFGVARLLDILAEFETSPPFIHSSAFPWKKVGKDFHYFLPRPHLQPLTIDDLKAIAMERAQKQRSPRLKKRPYHSDKLSLLTTSGDYKLFKKISWIPLTEFRLLMKDMAEANHFRRYLDNKFAEPNFNQSGAVQKNSIDRLANSTTGSGNTFYQKEIAFRQDHGLYFLIRTDAIEDYLTPVLRFLQDSGIGPDARTGKNWFSVEIEGSGLFPEQDGNAFISLSRYIANEPLIATKSLYKLAFIRSKVESREEFAGQDVWKDQVTCFTPGSVIVPQDKKDYYGQLAPVKEIADATIRQYGYAYPVWIDMEETDAI